MYYYGGYNGGYGNMNPYTAYYPTYNSASNGYGAAIILVLFILLVVVFGAGFLNVNHN
jgi:ABC-type sugar transport system permease subunit